MLRFKQFLILEDTTITPRQHLIAVYGYANAEKMIKSIEDREKTDGSVAEWNALRGIGNNTTTSMSKNNLTPNSISTFDNFRVPNYSKTNLDRPTDIIVKDLDPHPALLAAGYSPDEAKPIAQAHFQPVNDPETARGKIEVNKNPTSRHAETRNFPNWFSNLGDPRTYGNAVSTGSIRRDILGHELTHTLQTDLEKILPEKGRKFPITSDDASDERKQHRVYSQNAEEPAANMSDLKHLYYGATKKILPANMTDQDKEDFKQWYKNTPSVHDWDKDDAIQLLDTPEGDELFRRTARVTKPNTSNTGIA